jgi:hypothetical protein
VFPVRIHGRAGAADARVCAASAWRTVGRDYHWNESARVIVSYAFDQLFPSRGRVTTSRSMTGLRSGRTAFL